MRPVRAAALGLAGLAACTLRIAQPEPPPGPTTTVYLVAEEGHNALLLPDGEDWVEFGFGDYGWYVHGRGDGGWAMYTAMADSPAALARRAVAGDPLADPWSRARGWVLYPFEVPAEAVPPLREALEAEFAAGGMPVFNPLFGFWVVRAARPYSMWFNCTDAVAVWLGELGVPVSTRGVSTHLYGAFGTGIGLDGETVR